MQTRHVGANQTIFRAGDPSLEVFIIEDGAVAITVGDTDVAVLQAGELFGESGVLEDRARTASATAVTATTLLVTDATVFKHAFGMNNDRALSLVKLLCRRLRSTTLRTLSGNLPDPATSDHPLMTLLPDHERLVSGFAMAAVPVGHLPFQVGNRFGGETLPIASDHSFGLAAHGMAELAAPHFEILRRDGRLGIRDLGSRSGTIVNGVSIHSLSREIFVPLHAGDNTVIAGSPNSPFRFRLTLRSG